MASVPFEARELFAAAKGERQFPWYYIAAAALLALGVGGVIVLKLVKGKKEAVPERPEVSEAILAEMKARAEHEDEFEKIRIEEDPIYVRLVEIARDYPELVANVVSKWIREEGLAK